MECATFFPLLITAHVSVLSHWQIWFMSNHASLSLEGGWRGRWGSVTACAGAGSVRSLCVLYSPCWGRQGGDGCHDNTSSAEPDLNGRSLFKKENKIKTFLLPGDWLQPRKKTPPCTCVCTHAQRRGQCQRLWAWLGLTQSSLVGEYLIFT